MKWLRCGLALFFFFVLVEGVFRKWVFPGQQQIVYLVKDVWLLLMTVGLALSGYPWRLELRGYAVGFLLCTYGLYVALSALHPALPSLTAGLWGLRSHVLYATLVWLIPAAFRSSQEISTWFRLTPLFAAPIFALGIVQFLTPPNSVINRYAVDTNDIALFGPMVTARITGTFPYISGMVTFVFLVLLICVVQVLVERTERHHRAWFGLALAAIVSPMTGARWLLWVWVAVFPLIVIEMMWRVPSSSAGRLARLATGSALVAALVAGVANQAIVAFSERARTASDTEQRVRLFFSDPFDHAAEAGLFGFGAGSTHQATPTLVRDRGPYDWLPTRDFENEAGRLVLELGVVGALIAFGLKIAWILTAHNVVQQAATPTQFMVALIAFGFFVAHLTSSAVFNATAAAFYWGLAGMLAVVIREQEQVLRA